MIGRLNRLDLTRPGGALAAVLLARVVWGAWAAFISGLFPDSAFEASLPLLPPQLLSGLWWHRALISPWMRYDFEYYEEIVVRGYRTTDGTASFHPLYPLLARPLWWITGNAQASLLLVSTLSAWGATLLIARYVRRFGSGEQSARTANVAAWCLLLNPLGWVLLAPYTESSFLLLCIGALWAIRERKFWVAALLAALATLVRQQGVLLLAPLAWELSRRGPQVLAGRARARDWLCLALVPLAFASYSLYRVRIVGDKLDTGRGLGAYLASWIVSPSTRLVVPGSGLAPPWRAVQQSLYLLRFMPNPYHVFLDAGFGWGMIAILMVGWKRLDASEKWLCAGVLASALCFSAQAYMSFPRHLMLAFPLSILAARWGIERGRTRLLLEGMAIGGLLLCAAFVRHGWVP